MFATFKSYSRYLGVAGTGLALAGVAAMPIPAVAADERAESVKPLPAQASTSGGDRQIVVRDAVTGKLRPADADEAQALQPGSGESRMARPMPLSRYHANGARGARLTDEFMSYSVAVRQADGSMVTQCFESREEADAALKAGAISKTSTAPTE